MLNTAIKIIATVGPATSTEADIKRIKNKGVDFVRINMSHSTVEQLEYFIGMSKKIGIPFILDTEGSQIRTGDLIEKSIELMENDEIKIYSAELKGDKNKISLKPGAIIGQLDEGDILYTDFDALILRVSDISLISMGFITARAINSGTLGRNKGVVVDSGSDKKFDLPPLSEKDYKAIEVGLREDVGYIAASFMRSGESVDIVRKATRNQMKIISKIECSDALGDLESIVQKSDFLLFDRGDMSKEIAIEKIPFLQKILLQSAAKQGKEVFVATNLLETMVTKKNPTRAEVHDIVATILDGAGGLTLSAETAIGQYPMECINVMKGIIKQATMSIIRGDVLHDRQKVAEKIVDLKTLMADGLGSNLVQPHGGILVDRLMKIHPTASYLSSLPAIKISAEHQMDVEQIAIGTFSPLEGFMNQQDLNSVLDAMRLSSGVIWTIPIILDVPLSQAKEIKIGSDVLLLGDNGPMAILHVEDIYSVDNEELAMKLYGTTSEKHPGVRSVLKLQPVLLGGKISLFKRRREEFQEYAMTPRQVRRLFAEKHWSTVVGFHTRNAIHRGHEFIQIKALENEGCDGLFVHPIIGKKKHGDFKTGAINASYQEMVRSYYPPDRVVYSHFASYPRYAGPREAIFTAICRKNFGCSHFIVGRDHTGVGNFYDPMASHTIFDQFPDLGIKPVKFDKVFYSMRLKTHVHASEKLDHDEGDQLHISGTEARELFERGKKPPSWFMRPEISHAVLKSGSDGVGLFVKEEDNKGIVVWFTGLSGSGKSAIADGLKKKLEHDGKRVIIIDGDSIRATISQHLGFSRAHLKENNKIMSELAAKESKEYDYVLVPKISPNAEDRKAARETVRAKFIEFYINCPLEVCIRRDVKGLYKRALSGEIDDFIGISDSSPYEVPEKPDLEIRTDQMDISQCVDAAYTFLVHMGNA